MYPKKKQKNKKTDKQNLILINILKKNSVF